MIRKTFAHHSPSPECLKKIRELRMMFSNMASVMEGLCPPSRELSVALTNLETTAMWAIKAVIVNDPNSKVEDA